MKKSRIHILGDENTILFEGTNYLNGCSFSIHGNGNHIVIRDLVCAYGAELCVEDNGGTIEIGKKTLLSGKIEFASTEGASITVGENCLFSADIDIRSGDSHSIFDLTGHRINAAQPITIGNHVWVGRSAKLLKGARIADDSVVGAGAIVTGAFEKPNVVLAGVPARVVKENINWTHERTN